MFPCTHHPIDTPNAHNCSLKPALGVRPTHLFPMCKRWEIQFWSGFYAPSGIFDEYKNIHQPTRAKEVRGAGTIEYETKCLRNLHPGFRDENYRVHYYECRDEFYKNAQWNPVQVVGVQVAGGAVKPFCESDATCQKRVRAFATEFEEGEVQCKLAREQSAARWEKVVLADRLKLAWKEWVEVYRCHIDCPGRRCADPDVEIAVQLGCMVVSPGLTKEERLGEDPSKKDEPLAYTRLS